MLEWAAWTNVCVLKYDWANPDLDALLLQAQDAMGYARGNRVRTVGIMARGNASSFCLTKGARVTADTVRIQSQLHFWQRIACLLREPAPAEPDGGIFIMGAYTLSADTRARMVAQLQSATGTSDPQSTVP